MLANIIRFVIRGFLFLAFRIEVRGTENLCKGKVITAVNHRSNWDPVIMGAVSPRRLRFFAKAELFKNKIGAAVITACGAFPVERGKGDIGAIKTAIKILDEEQALLIFPEGKRTTDESGERAKTGVVMIASHAKAPVVPVYISGKYRWMGKLVVSFGKPIDILEGTSGKLTREQMQQQADRVLASIRALKV